MILKPTPEMPEQAQNNRPGKAVPVYVTGWCGHSQPFLLIYPEADLTYYF